MSKNIINNGVLDDGVAKVRKDLKKTGFYSNLQQSERIAFNLGTYEMLWALHEAGWALTVRTDGE
jgi:hypothetical protein